MTRFEARWKLAHRLSNTAAGHGRSDWLGYWVEFVQKARFKKLACLGHIKQNDLTYLGEKHCYRVSYKEPIEFTVSSQPQVKNANYTKVVNLNDKKLIESFEPEN